MKTYRFIDKIGVELEGGWNGDLVFDLDHDGSVNVDADRRGELPSPPLKPKEVENWMLAHYPDAVNHTCGMHVHISLNQNLHYAKLMEKKFHDYLKLSLKNWGNENNIRKSHPFWDRLAGKNTFCKDEFYPELQIQHTAKGGHRYTQLNYTWGRYRTIECRVLPMFKVPEIGVSGVFAVIDAFEDFLRNSREKEKPIEIVLLESEI